MTEPPSETTRHATDAPRIRCDEPESYAWNVFHSRHPTLIRRILGALPYGPSQAGAFSALLTESQRGDPASGPDPAAPDAALWQDWGTGRVGTPWPELPFLWAESLFYRRLLDASGYFSGGAWQGIDIFAPFKDAELDSAAFGKDLAALDDLASLPGPDLERALLHAALWGNQADLGFTLDTDGVEPESSGLLVADDAAELWRLLDGGELVIVADNSARELLGDLALIDHLLAGGRAGTVDMIVKPHPYYVSDATTRDVLACLARMTRAPGAAAPSIGKRLDQALRDGRFRLSAHPFACAPLGYPDMPDDLRDRFAGAALTLMKGDLNYRRLTDDRHWPTTVPFAEVTVYFPGPLAALRTLKSDTLTGLTTAKLAALNATGTRWRTAGTHALIQVGGRSVPGG